MRGLFVGGHAAHPVCIEPGSFMNMNMTATSGRVFILDPAFMG